MDDRLLNYYEEELTFIRKMGAEFARKYPKIAGRLLLDADRCEDPHTERLIEAFAFISGRIHKKIDDDFPEITESLLQIIYPHFSNPVPSMAIVQFDPIQNIIPPNGYNIEKNTMLYSKPVGGQPCQFTTVYPVTMWPVEVVSATLRDPKKPVKGAQQAIVLQLKTSNNLNFSQLTCEKLRFFLNGPHQHVFHLYELLFNHVCGVVVESPGQYGNMQELSLSAADLEPVGFNPEEGMLPYPRRSFPGYLLLLEYFCFPEKFLFFDLKGMDRIRKREFNDTVDIWIYLDRIAKSNLVVSANTFCLNATPVVNLFNRIAEPIRVEHRKTDYHVIPDIRRHEATEIFRIDRVTSSDPGNPGKEAELKPFYSLRHHLDDQADYGPKAYYQIQRRASDRAGDDGTEIFLSFRDLNFEPVDPQVEILTVHVTCTNRNLPARLPFGERGGDFYIDIPAPITSISSIVKPTPSRQPALGGALQWRVISHLALNYTSLVQEGIDPLREILKLYDFDNSPASRQQINGISSLHSKYVTKRIGMSVCRGVQVTIEFDEKNFVGTGLYLFASVLERFLGVYVSVNSFSQLVAKITHKKEAFKTWPPRSGNRVLV